VELDSFGDWNATPGVHAIVVFCCDGISTGAECWGEGLGDSALELIAGHFLHLAFDHVQRLAFALADLDHEELEEVSVVVRRGGTGAFGAIEQAVRDVEAHSARARRDAGGCVGGAETCGVDEGRCVRGESAGVPGGVPRVSAEECDGGVCHAGNIMTAAVRRVVDWTVGTPSVHGGRRAVP
jgi:hypothetical protein